MLGVISIGNKYCRASVLRRKRKSVLQIYWLLYCNIVCKEVQRTKNRKCEKSCGIWVINSVSLLLNVLSQISVYWSLQKIAFTQWCDFFYLHTGWCVCVVQVTHSRHNVLKVILGKSSYKKCYESEVVMVVCIKNTGFSYVMKFSLVGG
jgi:hypothetical protein